MAHRHLQAGRHLEGERMGLSALRLDATKEAEVRTFVQALASAGDRASAVGFFEAFNRAIRDELELEPSPETLELVGRIRGHADPSAPALATADPTPTAASPGAEGSDIRGLLEAGLSPHLEVVRRIGSGSVAEVYLARQRGLGRLVAVKVLSPDLAADPVAKARFEREAHAAASLSHPHAVTVFRVGSLGDGVPYLVMQYVKGSTLEERLNAEGPLAVREARRILAEVAGAVAAAHRSGFVHRDIRPANVLWDREDNAAFLTDFGLAGILPEREGSLPRVTRKGEVVGDMTYLSPEQFQGEPPTEAGDIYALGIMGYEILTGFGPFQAKSLREMATAHMHWKPPVLTALRDDVDHGLADLLERCLAKEPGNRPSAAFLAKALQEGGDTKAATGDRRTDAKGTWLRRTPLEIALLLALAIVITTLGIVALVQ
jgi:serine/threonine protein kinase